MDNLVVNRVYGDTYILYLYDLKLIEFQAKSIRSAMIKASKFLHNDSKYYGSLLAFTLYRIYSYDNWVSNVFNDFEPIASYIPYFSEWVKK